MKSLFQWLLLTSLAVCLCGCWRDSVELTADILSIDPSFVFSAQDTNRLYRAVKSIDELSPEDVILIVNEAGLTKRAYDQVLSMKIAGISSREGMTDLVADKHMEAFQKTYFKKFIAQRLLVDHAFAIGVVTTNEVLRHVEKVVIELAKKRGKSAEHYLKNLGAKRQQTLYEFSIAYIMDKLIHEKIPPSMEVTEKFVKDVKAEVARMNAEAAVTNQLMKSRLQGWKAQIIAKNEDFLKIAARVSDPDEDNPSSDDGVWGEFEEGDLDTPEMRAKVFALREGEISDVLEDDNGFHLIKVLSITSPVTNESGRVIEREKRKLSHIYLEKAPLLLEEGDIVLTHDLKKQMQLRAVDEYVSALSTNGVNRIINPHGLPLL